MTTHLSDSYLEAADVDYLRAIPARVEARGMYGQGHLVNALVTALLTGGHVLLEGNPGLGKTALVRALSDALGLGRKAVGRIQFTPDLMPADITGTMMPDESGSGRLTFTPGPVFCNLLLADEINRATAKTQSAMLEAMAEYQVTVLGRTYALRDWRSAGRDGDYRTPFVVMATQNPIDQDGTYALPEAQADRFMFKINMAMPSAEVLGQIVDKELKGPRPPGAAVQDLGQASDSAMAELHRIADAVLSVPLLPLVRDHIINIVQASNGNLDALRGVGAARRKVLAELVARISYPLGPRAGIALARAAIGWSAVALVEPDRAAVAATAQTPRALAEMVVPVLRHRLHIRLDHADLATPRDEALAIDSFVRALASAAAPEGTTAGNYPEDFRNAVERARRDIHL